MKCSYCRKEIPENLKYCVFCGAKLLEECPKCKKNIKVGKRVCSFCGVDVPTWKRNLDYLQKGKEAEHHLNYKKAKEMYEKIKNTEIKEGEKLLKEVEKRLAIIKKNKEEAQKWGKKKKWFKLRRVLKRIIEVKPNDEFALKELERVEKEIKKIRKRISVGVIIGIIIGGVVGWYNYEYTLRKIVIKELRKLVSSSNLEVSSASAIMLGYEGDKSGIPILRLLSNSRNSFKRIHSLVGLLMLGDEEVIPLLLQEIKEGEIPLKIASLYAITKMKNPEIIPYLLNCVESENLSLKVCAGILLLNMKYSIGLSEIKEILQDTVKIEKIKTLYAMHLLGDKMVFRMYQKEWEDEVKKLLRDESELVQLFSALILSEKAEELSKKDSILISEILWKGYVKKMEEIIKGEGIIDVSEFEVVRSIIEKRGESNFTRILETADKVVKKCNETLARLELEERDKIIKEIKKLTESKDRVKKLYAFAMLMKERRLKGTRWIKRLMKEGDEVFRLNVCKVILRMS
jgi:hypothetical protein